MDINLEIDQILLENFDLSYSQRLQLQAAVEAELSQLLTPDGLPSYLQNRVEIPRISTRLELTENSNPVHMGKQIAQSIYHHISGKRD
jgi:hypothetical protein